MASIHTPVPGPIPYVCHWRTLSPPDELFPLVMPLGSVGRKNRSRLAPSGKAPTTLPMLTARYEQGAAEVASLRVV
jgi:hypothetical protein